jgi:hypothetical protein
VIPDYQNLETELRRILDALKGVFTGSQCEEVESFLRAGEYGVAFETLCGIAVEEHHAIPIELRPVIRSLAQEMGIDPDCWEAIV